MIQLTFNFELHDPCYNCGENEARQTAPVRGHGICDACAVSDEKPLQDPCEWCKSEEAAHTITVKGKDQGICNSCAEDDYYDWHEQMVD